VRRVQWDDTLYSVVQWLNDSGVTPPRLALARRKNSALAPGEEATPFDERDTPQARPRAMKGTTSALLSGRVLCGHCDGLVAGSTPEPQHNTSSM
jgi:hypothetical protein